MATYYTVDEVAELLAVHPRSVRRYIQSDALKAVKIGGKWKVKKEDLTDYVNGDRGLKHEAHDHIKEDDLCVFMDSSYHRSDQNIQICSIIDVQVTDQRPVLPLTQGLMEIVNHASSHCGENAKFQYVYKEKEKQVRFVVWGEPETLERVMAYLRSHV